MKMFVKKFKFYYISSITHCSLQKLNGKNISANKTTKNNSTIRYDITAKHVLKQGIF